MYKIGEFSSLSKTTIKTLRYYEKENLLLPCFVDTNGYRYYEAIQLLDLAKIISLRQTGFSIEEIKRIICGEDINLLLENRKKALENELIDTKYRLSKINYLLEEKNMSYEAVLKELPDYLVCYKEGIIDDFSKITEFVLKFGEEANTLNPDIKCIEPDYCYINYLDGEYKDKNIKVRYAQAVTSEGKSNDSIKFEKLESVDAICIYHKGAYENLGEAYGYIMKYIEENNYQINGFPRERYIDGIWNKENVDEWLTEIQVPVIK